MAGPPLVKAHGVAELQRDLNSLDKEWGRELRRGNKAVAEKAVGWGKARLNRGSRLQRHVAGLNAVRARAQQRFSIVEVNATSKKNAMAMGAELGSKQYRQFPKYREDIWRNGIPVGGYGVGPAIRDHIDDIRDEYDEMIGRLTKRAFPIGKRPKVKT